MLFTFPSRYWFTIGLPGVFSLAGWTRRIHPGLHVSRATQVRTGSKGELREGGCHPLRPNFPDRHARSPRLNHMDRPTTPFGPKPKWFGLFPLRSPLLGESFLFSFPAGTKMFQFPALASVNDGCHPFRMTGCPIRTPAGQWPFAPNRRFSQLITSFFASGSLGIHHAPLIVFLLLLPNIIPKKGQYGKAGPFAFVCTSCQRSIRIRSFIKKKRKTPSGG